MNGLEIKALPHVQQLIYSDGKKESVALTLGTSSYMVEFFYWLPHIRNHVLIGNFCSFARQLSFNIGRNHDYRNVTNYPLTSIKGYSKEKFKRSRTIRNPRQIIIGSDVWIGQGVTIMGGVKIGNGAVIGAGAVVAKDIPPYAIAVGNPARVIKYRFDEATIKRFLAVKWWNWSLEKIADNVSLMTDVEKFLAEHYSPELEKIPEDVLGQHIKDIRVGGGYVYNFIADFRAKNPLWLRVVAGFCQSKLENSLLVIWQDKNSTEKDFEMLAEFMKIFGSREGKIIVADVVGDKNFSPYAIRQGTHFITTREMTTLEVLDYLWNTDVKIVSALDDGIFDGEPPIDWNTFLK